MTQSNSGNGPTRGDSPGQPTGAMTMPERMDKPAVSPTVVDDARAPAQAAEPPWAKAGRTQPGEPPLMSDMAPHGGVPYVAAPQPPQGGVPYVAAPQPPQGGVPYVAAPQPPQASPYGPPPPAPYGPAPAPVGYRPAMMPMPRRRRGGGAGVLVLFAALGLLVVGGAVAGVVALRPASSEDPAQSIDLGSSPQTEVKPEVPTAGQPATAAQPPPTPAAPAPAPAPVVHTKPRATAAAAAATKPRATATAKPTATAKATKPTASATTAAPSATSNPPPRRPVFRFPKLLPRTGPSGSPTLGPARPIILPQRR